MLSGSPGSDSSELGPAGGACGPGPVMPSEAGEPSHPVMPIAASKQRTRVIVPPVSCAAGWSEAVAAHAPVVPPAAADGTMQAVAQRPSADGRPAMAGGMPRPAAGSPPAPADGTLPEAGCSPPAPADGMRPAVSAAAPLPRMVHGTAVPRPAAERQPQEAADVRQAVVRSHLDGSPAEASDQRLLASHEAAAGCWAAGFRHPAVGEPPRP